MPLGCSLHVDHGAVAASGWCGCFRAVAGFVMQQMYVLYPLLPGPSSIVSVMIIPSTGHWITLLVWPKYGCMDVVILPIYYKVTLSDKDIFCICCWSDKSLQLRVRGWTCFAGLWTRTRTFGISLSGMFMLILCLFRGGGGGWICQPVVGGGAFS